jgi:uncharacterized protein
LRTVIDTGVLVSALMFPDSVPSRAFDMAKAHGDLLASEETIAELYDVIRRPKFDKYVSEFERIRFLSAMNRDAQCIELGAVVTDCRDPKDNKFLELALSGRATHIITGDSDLLVLHPFRGITIVKPKVFLSSFSV